MAEVEQELGTLGLSCSQCHLPLSLYNLGGYLAALPLRMRVKHIKAGMRTTKTIRHTSTHAVCHLATLSLPCPTAECTCGQLFNWLSCRP
jgi:hypothetical protein